MATDMSTGKHWCPDCDGGAYCPRMTPTRAKKGGIMNTYRDDLGWGGGQLPEQSVCPTCLGLQTIGDSLRECPTCHGTGQLPEPDIERLLEEIQLETGEVQVSKNVGVAPDGSLRAMPTTQPNHGQSATNVHKTGESVDGKEPDSQWHENSMYHHVKEVAQPEPQNLPKEVVGGATRTIISGSSNNTTSIICGHCGRRYRLADGHSCKERYQPRTPQIAALDKDKEIE